MTIGSFAKDSSLITADILNTYYHFSANNELKTEMDDSGNIFITGWKYGEYKNTGEIQKFPYYAKFDSEGNIINEALLIEHMDYEANDIIICKNGDAIILLNSINREKMTIIKKSAQGEYLWQKNFDWSNRIDVGCEFLNEDSDNISILGMTEVNNKYEYFKLHLSENGDSLSTEFIPYLYDSFTYNIADTTIMQIGYKMGTYKKGIGYSYIAFALNEMQASEKTKLTYKSYSSDFGYDCLRGYNIYKNSDTSYLVLGFGKGKPLFLEFNETGECVRRDSSSITVHANTSYYTQAFRVSSGWIFGAIGKHTDLNTSNNTKLVIEKRDSNFVSQWTREFDFSGRNYSYKIEETEPHNYLLMGYGLEMDSAYTFISIKDNTGKQTSNNINSFKVNNSKPFQISFFTANQHLNITSKINSKGPISISIFNLKGQEVYRSQNRIENNKLTINCKDFSSGSYLLHMNNKTINYKSKFLVK